MSYLTSTTQHDSTLHSCYIHHCIATIEGLNSYISSLAIGEHFLFTGSSDKEIRLWNRNHLLSSQVYQESLIHDAMVVAGNGAVKSMVVSSDKLFTSHQDHKIRVWKIIADHESQQNKLTHLATLPTLSDRALKLLIPKHHVQVRRHKRSTWVHHLDTVSALAVSNDGSLLYSVSWDRTLKIWQTSDFKCLQSIPNAHDDAINAIALSSNGDVYTGSADKRIRVWRKLPSDGTDTFHRGDTFKIRHCTDVIRLVSTLEKHKSGINALALSSDGNMLYSGGSDRCIVVWEKNSGGSTVAVGGLRGHTKAILCLTVVSDSDLVCSGSADETIRIWRGVDKCYFCLAILEGHNGPVKCLTLAKDEDDTSTYLIYSGGLDCNIKVWRVFVGSD